MTLQVTEEAIEMLGRALELGGVDRKHGGVRLRAARSLGGDTGVQVELAEGPGPGEETVEQDGVRVFLDPGFTEAYPDSVVALDPEHDRIVIRPAETRR